MTLNLYGYGYHLLYSMQGNRVQILALIPGWRMKSAASDLDKPKDEPTQFLSMNLHCPGLIRPCGIRLMQGPAIVKAGLLMYVIINVMSMRHAFLITLDSCLQETPDTNFILDCHPKYKNIVIGAGFSGEPLYFWI